MSDDVRLSFEEKHALADLPCPGGYEHEFRNGFENAAGVTFSCDYCPALRHQPPSWGLERQPWDPVRHGAPPEYRSARTHVSAFECLLCGAVIYDQTVHNWWHGMGTQQ